MTAHAVGKIPDALFLMFLRNFALIVLVAGVAGVGGIAIGMAGRARPACPTMVHREGMRTIERGRPPGAGRMAQAAIEPEQPGMERRFAMALEASRRRPHVAPPLVTLETGSVAVGAVQREARKLVVEGHFRPAVGGMAGAAVVAELTTVPVIFLVTGNTLGRRVDKLPIDMTPFA